LLADKRVASEGTSKSELDELRARADVNLKDAQIATLSATGRYEFAYNAARHMATIVVRASGYRVTAKSSHHVITFQALQAAEPAFAPMAVYFDRARVTRNEFSYNGHTIVSARSARPHRPAPALGR
jgi:hypothetical protein